MLRSRPLALLGLTAVVVGVWLSTGPPRLLLLNQGLRLQHPWWHGAALALAAAGAGALTASLRPWWARLPALALALLTALSTFALVRFRLETDDNSLRLRDWTHLRETTLPWAQVAQVSSGEAAVLVSSTSGNGIRIDTHDLRPADRATLDRAIARHLGAQKRQ